MVLVSSTVSLMIFYRLDLSVTDGRLIIVDLSISSCRSVNLCLTYFDLLLGTYAWKIVMSSCRVDPSIIMKCLSLSLMIIVSLGWLCLTSTQFLQLSFDQCQHGILVKERAAHSSVLAWRILGTAEPGGLLSMGLERVGHD